MRARYVLRWNHSGRDFNALYRDLFWAEGMGRKLEEMGAADVVIEDREVESEAEMTGWEPDTDTWKEQECEAVADRKMGG